MAALRTGPAELDGPIVVAQLDAVIALRDAPRGLLLRLVAISSPRVGIGGFGRLSFDHLK